MPITFRYPAPGNTGAVAGGDLVTACGEYTPPGGGHTSTFCGMVYPSSGPFDPTPPGGESGGFCNASTATWNFGSCMPPLGGGLTVGTSYVLRVWQLDSNSSTWQFSDCPFTACMAGSGDCFVDCPASAPGPGPGPAPSPFGCESIVISTAAARKFRVMPSAGVAGVMEVFGQPPLKQAKHNIVLTFDENVSTHDRAIWVAPLPGGQRLRLEVGRGGCCYQAIMTRVRVMPFVVETLDRWASTCFDIIEGGELCGLTASCQPRDGGVQLVPVGDLSQFAGQIAPMPPPPSAPAPKRTARPRRAPRGRK